ncbi:MAG: hypothetical protein K1X72_22940 [Pyrinomonadaceae bacterium]|nr:hypothetical protein [Pyrinomonadaceae bacterium]
MKTLLVLSLVLCGFITTFAQEKVIQKSEFDGIVKNVMEIFKSRPFRITSTSEIHVNGKPQENRASKTVIEVNKNNRRFVNERTSSEKTSKREYIQIGEKAYLREDSGEWKETNIIDPNQTGSLKIVSEQIEYKLIGTEALNNQVVNVYLKTSNSKKIDSANNDQEILSVESVKYWIDKDGSLLKRETNRENKVGALTIHFHAVSKFEYDQNIQISPPK